MRILENKVSLVEQGEQWMSGQNLRTRAITSVEIRECILSHHTVKSMLPFTNVSKLNEFNEEMTALGIF